MLTIGCHLSVAKGFLAMAKDAVSIDANTFQFFTRNPRGGKAKAIDPADMAAFHEFAATHGITRILAHAPYTLNPCSKNPETREFARATLADDLVRMEETPGQIYNMHPGSHTGQGADAGIEMIIDALNEVLHANQTTMLLLETMAGKGSEVGRTFEEIARIIDGVKLSDHVGVCLDTCHIWDAGYDIAGDLDGVVREFDQVIGLDRLKAIHLNDSLNPCGAHKDRHARIGEGHIGLKALSAVTKHPRCAICPSTWRPRTTSSRGGAKRLRLCAPFGKTNNGRRERVSGGALRRRPQSEFLKRCEDCLSDWALPKSLAWAASRLERSAVASEPFPNRKPIGTLDSGP